MEPIWKFKIFPSPFYTLIYFTEENDVAFCLAAQQTLFQLVHAG